MVRLDLTINAYLFFVKIELALKYGEFTGYGGLKCNGKCLKHMADASDYVLALYHLKSIWNSGANCKKIK